MEIFGQHFTWTEIWGTLFGIAGVWLTLKQNILCFPAGIVNVGIYALLFFENKLYADAVLQIIYIVLLVYGWINWGKQRDLKGFSTSRTPAKMRIALVAICLTSTALLGFLFSEFTDASLPYLDSLLTSMSLIAQWMIAKKKIENWLIWIFADTLYVFMYAYKHLYLTSVLYFIFILLAVLGYREWKKSLLLHGHSR